CLGGSAAQAQQPAVAAADCNPCATACCDTKCGGVYGSVGILFLKNCANGNTAYTSFDCPYHDGVPSSHFTSVFEFGNGYDPAYRAEIGWTNGCGLGARFRYFHYESASTISVVDNQPDSAGPGDGIISVKSTATPLGLVFSSFGNDVDPSLLVFENRLRISTI